MGKWVRSQVCGGSQPLGCPWVAEGLHGSVWVLGGAQLCPTDLGEVSGGRLDRALGVGAVGLALAVWLLCAPGAWFGVGAARCGYVSPSQSRTGLC